MGHDKTRAKHEELFAAIAQRNSQVPVAPGKDHTTTNHRAKIKNQLVSGNT